MAVVYVPANWVGLHDDPRNGDVIFEFEDGTEQRVAQADLLGITHDAPEVDLDTIDLEGESGRGSEVL